MIIDTHSHYDSEQFDSDRDEILRSMGNGFILVNSGADTASSEKSIRLAEKYDYVYATVGVHPDEVGELFESCNENTCGQAAAGDSSSECEQDVEKLREDIKPGIDRLRKLAMDKKVVGIGEIGLDYHWNIRPKQMQKAAFEAQWRLAAELGLPVVIHSRDAAADTMEMVQRLYAEFPGMKIDMHCYSYSPEDAQRYLRLGMMFGIGGVATFNNAKKLKEVIEQLPLENLLLETDSPYLAPVPNRGKRNYSAYLTYVAEAIAEIKGLEYEEVLRVTENNAKAFFDFD